jgi:two-component system, OmpR family, response regulator VicR
MKVLLIEDDQGIIDAVRAAFEFRWPEAVVIDAMTGHNGVYLTRKEAPDVIVLDLNLPDISGYQVLREVRQFSNTPVIILTVRSEDEDVMKGLELGADDYITKPFNYLTLLARVKAVLRRTSMLPYKGAQDNKINARLNIDFVNQKVKVDNKQVKLTPIEYKLLVTLAKNQDKLVTYNSLNAELWNKDKSTETGNIKLAVRRLREKLKDEPPQLILNQRGKGYILKG